MWIYSHSISLNSVQIERFQVKHSENKELFLFFRQSIFLSSEIGYSEQAKRWKNITIFVFEQENLMIFIYE